MKTAFVLILTVVAAALGGVGLASAERGAVASVPLAHAAAACGDYATQLEAQTAADTRDADGDGIYCEQLPCPCSPAWEAQHGVSEPARAPPPRQSCSKPKAVVSVGISSTRFPAVIGHMRTAITAGWPEVMTINRRGAEERRARALRGVPTRRGYDRDEYPMAFARRSWKTHIAYVPSSENRGAGATIGTKLRRYCAGTRFRVIGY